MAKLKCVTLAVFAYLTVFRSAAIADSSYLDQGIQRYKEKDYKAAARCLSLAAKADQRNPSIYFYLGNCAYALGKRETAIKYYWYVAHYFSTTKEAYFSRDFLKRIDPDYSKNSAVTGRKSVASTNSHVATANAPKETESKEQLIDGLLHVLKSQGNRPNVSKQLIESAKQSLSSYPTALLALMCERGVKICLTPTTIDEDPRKQNTKPRGYEEGYTYKNCPGFCSGRTVVVCEYLLRGTDDSGWEPAPDPIGTLRHEMGHAIDNCLGGFSRTDEFKHAYYLDVGQIEDEAKPHVSYFLQTGQGGPSEAFAELVCYHFGGRPSNQSRCQLVHSSFKQASAVIDKKLLEIGQ